jgi:hypothetical protein
MREDAISNWHAGDITKWRLHGLCAESPLSAIGVSAGFRLGCFAEMSAVSSVMLFSAQDRSPATWLHLMLIYRQLAAAAVRHSSA